MKNKFNFLAILCLICFSCILFTGCTKTPNTYNIVVKSSHYNLGSIEGGNKSFNEGETIKIKATPATSNSSNTNPEFICWLFNNKALTTEPEYEFEVNQDTAGEYIALFSCEYLEYFSLTQIIFDTGIVETSNASITKISLELGNIEGITKEVYSIEPTATENIITLTTTDIYKPGDNPYAFDMQEDIFVKFVATYEQDGEVFVSTTSTKIPATNDVTKDSIGIQDTTLKLAINPTDADLSISLPNTPKLSLEFARLTTFEITNPEVEK